MTSVPSCLKHGLMLLLNSLQPDHKLKVAVIVLFKSKNVPCHMWNEIKLCIFE